MLTSKIVVALRPLQIFATCASIIAGSLDQERRNRKEGVTIVLLGGGLIAFLTIIVAGQTTWHFLKGREYQSHRARTFRWLADLFILLLIGAIIPVFFVFQGRYTAKSKPQFPYFILWFIVEGVSALLYLITCITLIVEDVQMRRTKPLLAEIIKSPDPERDTFIGQHRSSGSYAGSESNMSIDVESFSSKYGPISGPTSVRKPGTHLGAKDGLNLLQEPVSRFSAYST